MAGDNSKMRVVTTGDRTGEIVSILNTTTHANADQSLDQLARLVLAEKYGEWVRAYKARTGMPWVGEQ